MDRMRKVFRKPFKPTKLPLCVRCGEHRVAPNPGKPRRLLCEECETRPDIVLRRLAEHGNRDGYIAHLLTVARQVDAQKGIAPMEVV